VSYLLDTNVLSEARRRAPPAVAWLSAVDPGSVFLSVITIGEITKGIALRARTDPVAAASLDDWLDTLQRFYADRILAVDAAVAATWGRLMAQRSRPPVGTMAVDTMIAATARVHNLLLVTRNVADFADTGVDVINPWAA
jgi:predicted nucleic acid-binding protein